MANAGSCELGGPENSLPMWKAKTQLLGPTLLPPQVCISEKVESEVGGQESKPGILKWGTGHLNCQASCSLHSNYLNIIFAFMTIGRSFKEFKKPKVSPVSCGAICQSQQWLAEDTWEFKFALYSVVY